MAEIRELGPSETHLAHAAMVALRPGLGSEAEFVERVNRVQRPEGYRLVGSLENAAAPAAAAAGFRTGHFLAWGLVLYCDDLSTLPEHRGRGHAGALVDWMLEEARRLGCDEFHLDSGVGPDREAAHRLYMGRRMRISAHHFSIRL